MDPPKYEYREEELSEVSDIKSEVSHVALSEDTQDHDEQGLQDFLNTQKKSIIKNQVSKGLLKSYCSSTRANRIRKRFCR